MFKILIGHIFEDSFVESDLESAILSHIHFLYAASEDGLKLGRFRVLIKLQIRNERFSSISWKDVMRIPEALAAGCGADAPGIFAAWLSRQVPMHAFVVPGKRYDVGDVESYREVCKVFEVTSSSESMSP